MNIIRHTFILRVPILDTGIGVLVLLCITLLFSASCEKSSDLDARMAAVQGVYYLNEGEDTWHCPDGSLPDRLLDAKLRKEGRTWFFEYFFPYQDNGSWAVVRLCQEVGWDPFDSYYFAPLTLGDIPKVLERDGPNKWDYSFQQGSISIVAGGINLNWTK